MPGEEERRMPAARPRKDGNAPRSVNKRVLTELYVKKVRPEPVAFSVWDLKEPGLVLRVNPTGRKAFKAVYSARGRAWWHHVGWVGLADARKIAQQVRLDVAHGKHPVAERKAERSAGTFAELHERYLNEHAKKRNRSWRQAAALVERHLLPRWGKLGANVITRTDVRAAIGRIESPTVANQTLAAASAVFSWGMKMEVVSANPCRGVERNATKSRERVLSDAEISQFWAAFDSVPNGNAIGCALKALLLTGQRPGEVAHMRHEHIADGWWMLPGAPDPKIGWPGTKNGQTHRVWLPEAVRALIGPGSETNSAGFVFAGKRGGAAGDLGLAMRDTCKRIGLQDKVTPHDLRRTHGSTITRLGHGREAMNRIQNHKEGGIASVYDRFQYADENKFIMERVANYILALAEGRAAAAGNVVSFNK
jgi:integrase